MSRSKWKHSYITNDIISFFLINKKKDNLITKKTKELSTIYFQPKNTFSFYLQNRALQVTNLVFFLNKKLTFFIHNGKKFFPCLKTLHLKYKIGHFFYTRVTRQHVRKVRNQKKIKVKK